MILRLARFAILPLLATSLAAAPKIDKFRQLEELLPTPNEQRTASGAPGRAYWQQRADYTIKVELDDEKQLIRGSETVRYTNNSPDALPYLWLQLDANIFSPTSDDRLTNTAPTLDKLSYSALDAMLREPLFQGGATIERVSSHGTALRYTVVKTMMRIDLPQPLQSGASTTFDVAWSYPINDAKRMGGRSGYEYFEKDKNYLYEIAQFHPRMAAYTDVNGWQHKQFLGSGEFTLEFGDFDVTITVPADHIVAATGELQNPDEVLTSTMRSRLREAATASKPVLIVTPEEARANEKSRSAAKKTWHFRATNVRDFAFASSRKFIWDAQGHPNGGRRVMTMSFYPNEGNPLWGQFSTRVIQHTLNVYSRYTFDYPYPVAQSIHGPVGGMEYPMIAFNGSRPEEDGTYSRRQKYGLVNVIIHEVGHNYFPMTVNSDERQWTWMDEGINTFLQFLAEQEWEKDFPSRRGQARDITTYMASTEQVPVMTNSESLLQFGSNAYGKPAAALNILRDTILGRELFDFAFKQYAQRWKFKRPEPADFFRTMEDASGIDLDWFWRGWFYTTDHVDLAINNVRQFNIDTRDPDVEKALTKQQKSERPKSRTDVLNDGTKRRVDDDPELKDFYSTYDDTVVTDSDREQYKQSMSKLDEREKELLRSGLNFYVLDFQNVGGLVMPLILDVRYTDGSNEELRIPAEIWRYNSDAVSKLIMSKKEIASVSIDPRQETADTDLSNNDWPRKAVKSRFQLYKDEKMRNPMQQLEKKSASTQPEKP